MHLERINEMLSHYIGLQDLGGCISIQGSNIIALVALAEIYHHLSRNSAFHQTIEAQNRCLTAIEHVVAAVKDLRDGNHLQKVHIYTGVSQDDHLPCVTGPNNVSWSVFPVFGYQYMLQRDGLAPPYEPVRLSDIPTCL